MGAMEGKNDELFEKNLSQAKASLFLEGLEVKGQNEQLVRDYLHGKLSKKQFHEQLLRNIGHE
ncbi:hypothetical protein EDD68_1207 [Melghiribacillus thermohalophilus]|uniref:Antitoxin VbhA domain-containing protein n=2 Tax=Melghiribacillus thermohalophilus TaxID=1324956 RepID=A0A4R3MRN4_9BACI|nr:hypothetical protein EDD68_1207 [Melghiribacillus thermohalophilus]